MAVVTIHGRHERERLLRGLAAHSGGAAGGAPRRHRREEAAEVTQSKGVDRLSTPSRREAEDTTRGEVGRSPAISGERCLPPLRHRTTARNHYRQRHHAFSSGMTRQRLCVSEGAVAPHAGRAPPRREHVQQLTRWRPPHASPHCPPPLHIYPWRLHGSSLHSTSLQ